MGLRPPTTLMVASFIAIAGLALGAKSAPSASPNHPLLQEEHFDPPVQVNTTVYMTSLTTIRDIPGYPGLVVHVPCFVPADKPKHWLITTSSDLPTPKGSQFGWCTAQPLPGTTELIGRDGDFITPPP